MFTLEESGLLRRMLYVISWLLLALLVGGTWEAIHLIRQHHHQATTHAPEHR
jgi:hypothetical protein